jgi:putative membrane protein
MFVGRIETRRMASDAPARATRLRILLAGVAAASLAALAAAPAAEAHAGAPAAPHDALTTWTFDPVVLLLLGACGFLYGRGVVRVWSRAGWSRGVSCVQATAFAGGMLALGVALISPVDALASDLFAAHMVQHLLLMLVAAPLLALGAPSVAFAWGVSNEARAVIRDLQRAAAIRAFTRVFTAPLAVWSISALVLWAWHAPPLYDAALRHPLVHGLEHASFLGASMLFWWLLVARAGRRRFEYGAAAAFVFLAMLQTSILAALLTFSGHAWYAAYSGGQPGWHVSAIEDQQLAGLLMWIPSNVIYLAAALTLIARWLQRDDQGARETWRAPEFQGLEQPA